MPHTLITQGYGSREAIDRERRDAWRSIALGKFSAIDTYNQLTAVLATLDGREVNARED